MKILAVDTSCDETSVAVSEDDRLLVNVLSSQMKFHSQWGGVVPIIAKRNHEERIDTVINHALNYSGLKIEEIDTFAVTYGPGLGVALGVGIQKIRELALQYKKPVIAVNHMEGHIYANFAKNRRGISFGVPNAKIESPFPLLALLISGGHTEIVLMKDHLNYQIVGRTRDDSVGEAFDKVARMLKWGYPGGPIIEMMAKEGDENRFDFTVPMKNSGDLDFSYSGLKTDVLRTVKELGEIGPSMYEQQKNKTDKIEADFEEGPYAPSFSQKPTYQLSRRDSVDIAASFQKTATEELLLKTQKAVQSFKPKMVVLGGGVVNNRYIRKRMRKMLKSLDTPMHYPRNEKLLSDNAGMIAVAAFYKSQKQIFTTPEKLDRAPSADLASISSV